MKKSQGRAYGHWETEKGKAGLPGHNSQNTNSMTRNKKEHDQ